MSHLNEDNAKLIARVRRIGGQVSAIERSLTDGAECDAVLQQVAAARGALNGLLLQLLESHLREHAGEPDGIDVAVSVLKSYLK